MKIKIYVSTNKVGSTCERIIDIPNEDLEGLSSKRVDEIINEYAEDELYNLIDWGWEEVK